MYIFKFNLFIDTPLVKIFFFLVRILCTGDFIFSSSYDKTIKAWLFDTSELDEGSEDKACIRTFKGHSKGVYPLIFIPAEESLVLQNEDGPVINPGDLLISGKLWLFTLKFQSTYFSFFRQKVQQILQPDLGLLIRADVSKYSKVMAGL